MQRTITIKIENLVGSIYIKMSKGETVEDVTEKVSKKILQGLQAAVQSVQVAEVKGKREETFEDIYDMLEMRLNQLGDIQAKDAWHICRGKHSYSVITVAFKGIMHTMMEQGKAEKVKNGHYRIIASNQKVK